ncbi:MAG: DUF1697 domain-containing protein [Candidatus Cybelea sp.]
MARYAAFLRAVNVAGNQLSMAALKKMVEDLGLGGPRSVLQSGNLIFEAGNRKAADLEEILQRKTARRLKVQTEYFIRDAKALTKIIEDNPFAREAKTGPGHLVVFFLKQRPSAESVRRLQAQIKGPEVVKPDERHIYVTYPAGQGRSKLTNAAIEKALESRGTARNWNTILKMHSAMS